MCAVRTISAVIILVSAATARAGDDPVKRTEALIKAFQAVKPPPDDGSELNANDKLQGEVAEHVV